jgi:RHS repeat-associated protein
MQPAIQEAVNAAKETAMSKIGNALKHRAATAALVPAVGLAAALGCGSGMFSSESHTEQHALRTTARTVYYHAAFAAGANVITRDDGSVLDERRYEPFGASIGAIDFSRDPHNLLNKETDVHTGWSDHGARWMAPETARWLTPDPPVKAPDPAFMAKPWALHPYQYAQQNPVLFWDPDGRQPAELPNCPAPRPTNMLLDAAQRIPAHEEAAAEGESAIHEVHATMAVGHIVVSILEVGEKVVENKAVTVAAHVGALGGKTMSGLLATYHFFGWLDSQPGTEENDEHVGGMFSNTLAAVLPPVPAAILALAEIFIPDFNKQLGRPITQADLARAVAPQREAQARLERGVDNMSATLNAKLDALIRANPPPISCAVPEPPVFGPPAPRAYGPPAPEPVSRADPDDL